MQKRLELKLFFTFKSRTLKPLKFYMRTPQQRGSGGAQNKEFKDKKKKLN